MQLKLIPSGAERWVPCPGAPQMEAGLPRTPTHPTTEEGKALHWACERVGMSWLPRNNLEPVELQSFLGQACPENGVVITAEMLHSGRIYLEEIWGRAHVHPEGLIFEKQVSANRFVPVAGRADAIWVNFDGTWLAIYDLKYGRVEKHAYQNWQLILYALGALLPTTQTVELVLVQPRTWQTQTPVKTWIFPVAELIDLARWVSNSHWLAHQPNPPLYAGKWCRYCKAAAARTCPALAAATNAAMDGAERAIATTPTTNEIAHDLELMTRARDLVRARLDALEALAVARIEAGETIPGYAKTSTWSNRAATLDLRPIGNLFGVDLEKRTAMSLTEAEGAGMPRNVLDLFTERHENAPKLRQVARNEAREIFYKK